jgi:4-amino-4-deoxy-L-arabinose transferase-like glycosyltransferase
MNVLDMLSRWAAALLFLAVFARAVAMALLPLTDPTEGRYAQVSQEMALSGDWVTPRVWMNEAHLPFLGKPPIFFWAAAGAMKLCGVSAFAARLPSLLSALALLGLLYVVLERTVSRGAGLIGVLVAATSGFFFAVAGSVAVDMVLSACVGGSLLAYFAFLSEPSPTARGRWSLLVFFLLALGFLAKGPVALVLFGLPVLVWTIRWRAWSTLCGHRWLAGALLFLLVAAPWYILCELRNPGFLSYFFINENFLRFVTHDYGDAYGTGHLYPRGTAVLMLLAATAPWSLFALWRAFRDKLFSPVRRGSDKMASFLFIGFAAGTLFWCLARQLLITYLLPMVPVLAAWLVWVTRDRPAMWQRMRQAAAVMLVAMAVGAAGCCFFLKDVKTARGVVALAKEYAAAQAFKGPLLFERRTPYSALFYARGWVVPHPKEELSESLSRLHDATSVLVALQEKQKARLDGLPRGSVERLAVSGGWLLVKVSLPLARQ